MVILVTMVILVIILTLITIRIVVTLITIVTLVTMVTLVTRVTLITLSPFQILKKSCSETSNETFLNDFKITWKCNECIFVLRWAPWHFTGSASSVCLWMARNVSVWRKSPIHYWKITLTMRSIIEELP